MRNLADINLFGSKVLKRMLLYVQLQAAEVQLAARGERGLLQAGRGAEPGDHGETQPGDHAAEHQVSHR